VGAGRGRQARARAGATRRGARAAAVARGQRTRHTTALGPHTKRPLYESDVATRGKPHL
jgi:hypothetical protein